MGDILDHPTIRRRVRALRRLRSSSPYSSPTWCRRTSVRPPDDIKKSVTHRLGPTLRHAIVRQLCYPSKISHSIVVKLAFYLRCHFFQLGLCHLISRERRIARIIWKTARANYPKNAGDYPIAIHHPWHITSSVDAAGGQQSLMTAAEREI